MRIRILASAAVALLTLGVGGARLDAQAVGSVCKDGTTSATSGKGACSGHGGVDAKATSAAKKAAKAEKKADAAVAKTEAKPAAQVTCTDGTLSKPGRGACANHGGIKGSTPTPAATVAPKTAPVLPAPVPATSPARTRSEAKSQAPSATASKAATDSVGAIAQCKDGTYSHASTHKGACSRHGGVAKFLKP
jgi:hypothetical protein